MSTAPPTGRPTVVVTRRLPRPVENQLRREFDARLSADDHAFSATELSDALRRRCLFFWIDYPNFEKEVRVVKAKVPGINDQLAEQVCLFMQGVRSIRLVKTPGVAETLDWGLALVSLHRDHLDEATVRDTMAAFVKDNRDVQKMVGRRLDVLLSAAGSNGKKAPGDVIPQLREQLAALEA